MTLVLDVGDQQAAALQVGQHRFELAVEGEIRFGPVYCTMSAGTLNLGDRIFGSKALISDSGRYVLAEEWHTIREADGPLIGLVLLDLEGRRATTLRTRRGFFELVELDDSHAVYRHGVAETTTHIDRVDDWADCGYMLMRY